MTDRCIYRSRESLPLRANVPGARMWAVSLHHTMLTYFEVEPECRFETHTHVSEQITMVLEGVLYFETAEGVTAVGAGEVFAVPSQVPHAVYTGAGSARAVDAWSPVREDY